MNVIRVVSLLVLLLLILPIMSVGVNAVSVNNITRQGTSDQWPWGEGQEPFPWLEYLKGLTDERGVTLTIITRHESTIQLLTKQLFLESPVAQELGIVNIQFLQLGPDLWVDYIQRRIERGTPIDIAWGGGPTIFNYIDQLGYVMALNPSEHPEVYAILYEVSKIPERIAGSPTRLTDDNGYIHWIGAAISSFGITVNNDKANEYNVPKPKTWLDLAKPEYARYLPSSQLIAIADPLMSTSNTRMYEIILQAYGWEEGWKILTLMAANSKILDSSSGVRDAVIRGDVVAGITIDFYGYTAMHQNPACEYIIPENESIINSDPIALLADSKHPVHAAAFIAWVLSEFGGQVVWLDPNINRLPINAKVFDLPEGQERPDLYEAYVKATAGGAILFNESFAIATERAMQYYFKATLVNAHDDLQNTWAAIAKAYLDGDINDVEYQYLINKLGEIISFKDPLTGQTLKFTSEYAAKINPNLTQAEVASALLREWEEAARQNYHNVYLELQDILAGRKTITTPPTETTTPPTETGTTPTTPPTGSPTTPTPEGIPTSTIVTIIAIVILVIAIVVYFYIGRKR
ncbi:MAG: ABC transporter substrate-binding protein [Thermoprotei archaeon]|nr:MAG: ABC transporter substrate-binding protein [Thermoprotei archaeon]